GSCPGGVELALALDGHGRAALRRSPGVRQTIPSKSTSSENLRPVADSERIVALDVLRGFALYGVLLANAAPFYSGRVFLPQPLSPLDDFARILINIFVDGKAMTLFSFLFGLGFGVQLLRAEARGRDVLSLYPRRLGALLVISLFHIVVIYWGDI